MKTNATEQTPQKITSPYCPKGKSSYSQHRLKELSRKQVRPGIFSTLDECQLCGQQSEGTLDYNCLAGIF